MNKSSSAAPPEAVASAQARRVRRAAIPAVAVSLAVAGAQVALAAPGHAAVAGRIAVGSAPRLPHGAKAVAAPADSTKLTVDIQLKTPTSAELPAVAAAVNNPKSAYYHHFLAKGEIAKQFGASAAEIAAVDAALKAAGLTPGPVSADGLFISVNTTVGQAKAAFGTDFAGYTFAGRKVYANTSAPKFDSAVSADVAGVVGLDNIAYAVPRYASAGHATKAGLTPSGIKSHAAVKPNYNVPTCSGIDSIFNSSGLYNGTDYYTADALANIYGTGSLLTGGNNGTGVTVAVFELENYDQTGVSDIEGCYGISTPVSEVRVDGGPSAAADFATGVGEESALDIENIATAAPGVSIVDYAGPDAKTATDAQVLATYQQIVTDDTAQVISSSWGLCEAGANPSTISSENTIFSSAAAQGQTVIAASGDAGDTDCYDPKATTPDNELSVDDPASQPFVLGVGGTTMHGLSNNTMTESVWNSVQNFSDGPHYGAGGGGVSKSQTQPSYQAGIAATGYAQHCATAATTGCRQVPDVSALADPGQGYVADEYASSGPQGAGTYIFVIGGTSGAAPEWAAIYALADASNTCKASSLPKGLAGQAAPALYAAGENPAGFSVFRDVTTGNNGIAAYHPAYSYPATSGYDLASGWGTPVAPGVVTVACKGAVTSPASSYAPEPVPTRILDTRKSGGPVGANGGTVSLQITGANGVPAANVTAVALNVTVTGNAAAGYATVYPDGTAAPTASNLNWVAGQTVPNMVVVPVGADGKVDIVNQSGATVQFIADLAGYFTTDTAVTGASTYTAVGPVRAMDTRKGIGVPPGQVPSGGTAGLQVGGATIGSVSIPSGITAVAMNVTVTGPAASGYLTVYPNSAASRPTVSNLNFSANQTIANLAIVPVGADGKVDFYNGSGGGTDVIADIAGYFTAGTGGAKFHALGPDRVVDTRIGLGTTNGPTTVGAGGVLGLPVPSSATAILANLTVASTTASGYLTAYPDPNRPTVSNLNFSSGEAVPNLAIVPNNGKVDFYNGSGGSLRLIVDLGGYFSAS